MVFLLRYPSTFWQLATQSEDAAEPIPLPSWECQNILLTVAGQVSQPGWKTANYYYCYLQVMKRRHREMKELAYSPLVATLRRESRKSCGWSSALCIIPFSFPRRQCIVIGILHSVNTLQAITPSNLTTVFFLIFFNDQHIILPLSFYTLLLSHSRFSISSLERYCFCKKTYLVLLTSNTSWSESFVMKEECWLDIEGYPIFKMCCGILNIHLDRTWKKQVGLQFSIYPSSSIQ